MKKFILLLLSIPISLSSQVYHSVSVADGPAYWRGPVSFTIGQYAYAGLGNGDYAPVQNYLFGRYDHTTDTWAYPNTVAHFPGTGVLYATGFSVNNFGYVVGGYSLTTGSNKLYSNQLWEYDATNNAWATKASFPGAQRAGAVCFTINDKAYYGMGTGTSSYLTDMYEYDPVNNSWTQIATFPGALRGRSKWFFNREQRVRSGRSKFGGNHDY